MKRICITRNLSQTEVLHCYKHGINVEAIPLIQTHLNTNVSIKSQTYDAIIITSRMALKWLELHVDEIDKSIPFFCLTAKQKAYLNTLGFEAKHPEISSAEALRKFIKTTKLGNSLLFLGGNRSIFPGGSMKTEVLEVYRTELTPMAINLSTYKAIVFFSPSAATSFFTIHRKIPKELVFFAFGSQTANALKKQVVGNVFVSEKQDRTYFLNFIIHTLNTANNALSI